MFSLARIGGYWRSVQISGLKKRVKLKGRGRGVKAEVGKNILVGLKQCCPFPNAQPSHLQT